MANGSDFPRQTGVLGDGIEGPATKCSTTGQFLGSSEENRGGGLVESVSLFHGANNQSIFRTNYPRNELPFFEPGLLI